MESIYGELVLVSDQSYSAYVCTCMVTDELVLLQAINSVKLYWCLFPLLRNRLSTRQLRELHLLFAYSLVVS